MSKARRAWIVWVCYKCERRHKNEIRCGVMQTTRGYFWEWECDKCRKINRVFIEMKVRGKLWE